ncbi:MAG: autotransporter domain-containing protein [Parachlamydiaceae bacterium]
MWMRNALAVVLVSLVSFSGNMSTLGAVTTQWVGTTNDLANASNWNPSLPNSGSKAVFGTAFSYTPQLNTESFVAQLLNFNSSTSGYIFTNQNSSLNIQGADPSIPCGVLSSSTDTQVFNIVDGGSSTFYNNANAWLTGNTGSIQYNVGDPVAPSAGAMNFVQESSAGGSTIKVVGSNHLGVSFYDSSTAGSAHINLGESVHQTYGSLSFHQQAGAENSIITAFQGSAVNFYDGSSAQSSTMTIGDPSIESEAFVFFGGVSTAGSATMNVAGGSGYTSSLSVITFYASSNAGSADITIGNNTYDSYGAMYFDDEAGAANATITALQNSTVYFYSSSSAQGATINLGDNNAGATALFFGGADAGSSQINLQHNSSIFFEEASNAKNATISLKNSSCVFSNQNGPGTPTSGAGTSKITASSSEVAFGGLTSAENAQIQIGTLIPSLTGGLLLFFGNSTADFASLYGVGNASITFFNQSQAASSTIFLGEDVYGNMDSNGTVVFTNQADAGSCTVTTHQNSLVVFSQESTASQSSIILNDDSRLSFSDNTSSGSATITVGPLASINFEQDGPDTFTGMFLGEGSIYKTGSGSLTLASDNSAFGGLTTVTVGGLILNNILGGNLLIQNTGILSGVGTILGNLSVNTNGQIAPGNSIGTLAVGGNYDQSNSIYQVQVNGAGGASLINVQGTATLGTDAGVNVTPLSIPTGAVFTVPIVHADGGVSGVFSSLTTTNPLLTAALSYDLNNAYLTYENALTTIATTYNEQQVADQLVTIADLTAQELAVMTTLMALPSGLQSQALNQMSAQQYATLLISGEESTRSFLRRLYDPLRPFTTGSLCSCHCGMDVWGMGGWEKSSYGDETNADGFTKTGYEVSLGGQICLQPQWVVGAGITYEKGHFDYHIGGTGTGHTILGAIYALYRPECFYVMADLVMGGSKQSIHRPIDIGSIHYRKYGKPVMFQSALYLESGIDCWYDNMLFQPFIGLECGYYDRFRFKEKDSDSFLSVAVNRKSSGNVNSRLGCHFSSEWYTCLSLAIDAAWQCRMISLDHSIKEQFTTFGNTFQIKGISMPYNSIDGAVKFSYKPTDSLMIYFEALGQRWKKDSFYSFIGGIECTW